MWGGMKTYYLYLSFFVIGFVIAVSLSYNGYDVRDAYLSIVPYIVTLSISLVIFPLIAVPLLLQVLHMARMIGESASSGVYHDFNRGCLIVSLGSLVEVLVILLTVVEPSEFLIELSIGNLFGITALFVLITVYLVKIVEDLEPVFTG